VYEILGSERCHISTVGLSGHAHIRAAAGEVVCHGWAFWGTDGNEWRQSQALGKHMKL